MQKIKTFIRLGSALVLSISTLLTIGFAGVAHAATGTYYEWTGNASSTAGLNGCTSNCFSVYGNWEVSTDGGSTYSAATSGEVPNNTDNSGAGDNLVFDDTSFGSVQTVNNDISGLNAASITLQGNSGYSFIVAGYAITVNSGGITDNNSLSANYGNTTFTAPIDVNGSQTFTNNGPGPDYFSSLTGSGNVTVAGTSGQGAIEINDLSQYTGNLSSTSADIILGQGSGTFTSSGSVTVSGNGQIILANEGSSATYDLPLSIGGATGALTVDTGGTVTLAGTTTLTSNVQLAGQGILDITGPLSGSYALSVESGQQLTLQNNSSNNTSQTPGGGQQSQLQVTTVASGDNQPNLALNIQSNQEYIVNGIRGSTYVYNGGTLKGTGAVGSLTIEPGGIVSPGDAPGCLTASGNLDEGGTYQAEIGGTTACSGYDQIIVTSGNTVALHDDQTPSHQGILQVSLINGFVPKAGETFEIINNQGSNPVADTFQGLPEGSTITVSGVTFKISYVGGDGNDVVLTVETVPGTPDTGSSLTKSYVALPLIGGISIAGGLLIASKKNLKLSNIKLR